MGLCVHPNLYLSPDCFHRTAEQHRLEGTLKITEFQPHGRGQGCQQLDWQVHFRFCRFNCHWLPPSLVVKSQWDICSYLSTHFLIFLIILQPELQVRNKGWTQAISSSERRVLPFPTSHRSRKEPPHCYFQVQTQGSDSERAHGEISGTQRSGNALCTQWKVCPRLFGIASNLPIQTRLRFSAPEYTWAPRKNENSNHSPGHRPSPKPRAADNCQSNSMQAAASKGWATEFTSSLPASLGFCGDWHRPYFVWVLLFVLFCVTTLELNRIQTEANPVTEDPRKACLYSFLLILAASKWSLARAAQQAGTKRFCKCTVVSFPFQSTSELQWNRAGWTSDHIFFRRFGDAVGCGWLGSCNSVWGWGAGIHCEVNLV